MNDYFKEMAIKRRANCEICFLYSKIDYAPELRTHIIENNNIGG